MEKFFHSVRELSNEGLNPKVDLIINHIYESNVVEVFGGKVIKPFKTTNTMLHLVAKMALFSLYWRIYRSAVLRYNKFMA
jgi:uridylate kinase